MINDIGAGRACPPDFSKQRKRAGPAAWLGSSVSVSVPANEKWPGHVMTGTLSTSATAVQLLHNDARSPVIIPWDQTHSGPGRALRDMRQTEVGWLAAKRKGKNGQCMCL